MISKVQETKKPNKFHSKFYQYRDISWLHFNFRVLKEAQNKAYPLLERIKFLAITASNLDEFFEVRVASLEQKMESNVSTTFLGASVKKILFRIYKLANLLVQRASATWEKDLLHELAKNKIHFLKYQDLNEYQIKYVIQYFKDELHPVLTPIKIDSTHPFPWIMNKALCLAAIFKKQSSKELEMGVIMIPRVLSRIIELPTKESSVKNFIFLKEIIQGNIELLFQGLEIDKIVPFRVTRNSNLYVHEEETTNLLKTIETELYNRKKGDAVRLEIAYNAPKSLLNYLINHFDLKKEQVHLVQGPVNLHRIMAIYDVVDNHDLKFPLFQSKDYNEYLTNEQIFPLIQKQDILLHHPFQSFHFITSFLRLAAHDPNVLAIKMTIYRTNSDSPILHSLIEAARRGKEVTVVLELKARFDEESNVGWAKYLREHGVHVVFGLVGLKTHLKTFLIVRKEDNKIIKYAHISTGNYNDKTAKIYTDLSLLTTNKQITHDLIEIFNFLTVHSQKPKFKSLLVAPFYMLKKFIKLIENEITHVKKGMEAKIIFKVNSLQDVDIIDSLYKASLAGVKIIGIVRGICCLKTGKNPLAKNITIKSVIGRYLEHSRVFYFHNSQPNKIFIGSADWMSRNLRNRVEIVVPILDKTIEDSILSNILNIYLENDATKSKHPQDILMEHSKIYLS